VPQVRVRIERNRRKKNDAGLAQQVRGFYSNFKRRIIKRPLRPLHPVHHARAAGFGSAAASNRDARISRKPVKVDHI
jgi:hypothetical protein